LEILRLFSLSGVLPGQGSEMQQEHPHGNTRWRLTGATKAGFVGSERFENDSWGRYPRVGYLSQ